eukprot:1136237-Pelagomonas_calceolata.AAC.1
MMHYMRTHCTACTGARASTCVCARDPVTTVRVLVPFGLLPEVHHLQHFLLPPVLSLWCACVAGDPAATVRALVPFGLLPVVHPLKHFILPP